MSKKGTYVDPKLRPNRDITGAAGPMKIVPGGPKT